jgi:serine/threonine-protein kinase
VVFDKYALLEKVGEGGMGDVWRVRHMSLETERALKLIKPEIARNDKGWNRFRREALLMAKIEHPSVVAVYDFKRTHSMAYIEMEFVRGKSLHAFLKEQNGKPMPLERTCRVVEQLCAVLQEMHDHADENTGKPAPIIHRDLKPSNIMLVERRNQPGDFKLKVLDFGIAKMIEEEGGQDLTGPADFLGTPVYMSPEQIKWGGESSDTKRAVDRRSDLYSTGVLLYHLLTGKPPFRGNKIALLAAHLETAPPPMNEANPDAVVPPAVEAVVMRCLEKDPAKRFRTARELAVAFREGVQPGTQPSPIWPKVAAGVGVALSLGLVVWALLPPKPPDPAAAVSPPPGKKPDPRDHPDPSSTPTPREPAGYEAVERYDTVADLPKLPKSLRRKADGVVFHHFKDGMYLPGGYAPDNTDLGNRVGTWPKVIVRDDDGVRFIRMAAYTFRRGDPRDDGPAADHVGNACTPHYVRIRGFYIQETEVTNGEIDQYLTKRHPEAAPDFERWKQAFEGLTMPGGPIEPISRKAAGGFPAVCVPYTAARRYARSVGGLLPTEAEWEYAAKSWNDVFWYPWGNQFSLPGAPLRANFYSDAASPAPAAVKSFPNQGEDRTTQGVYDMAGNVRELCVDEYKPYAALDPVEHQERSKALVDQRELVEPKEADLQKLKVKVVVRGGSFLNNEESSKVFQRWAFGANDSTEDVGFRVVIECPDANGLSPAAGGP